MELKVKTVQYFKGLQVRVAPDAVLCSFQCRPLTQFSRRFNSVIFVHCACQRLPYTCGFQSTTDLLGDVADSTGVKRTAEAANDGEEASTSNKRPR